MAAKLQIYPSRIKFDNLKLLSFDEMAALFLKNGEISNLQLIKVPTCTFFTEIITKIRKHKFLLNEKTPKSLIGCYKIIFYLMKFFNLNSAIFHI